VGVRARRESPSVLNASTTDQAVRANYLIGRTVFRAINSQVLYRLSYRGMFRIVDHLRVTIKHEHGQALLICRPSRFMVAPL